MADRMLVVCTLAPKSTCVEGDRRLPKRYVITVMRISIFHIVTAVKSVRNTLIYANGAKGGSVQWV